jgi:hypothetical protein
MPSELQERAETGAETIILPVDSELLASLPLEEGYRFVDMGQRFELHGPDGLRAFAEQYESDGSWWIYEPDDYPGLSYSKNRAILEMIHFLIQ